MDITPWDWRLRQVALHEPGIRHDVDATDLPRADGAPDVLVHNLAQMADAGDGLWRIEFWHGGLAVEGTFVSDGEVRFIYFGDSFILAFRDWLCDGQEGPAAVIMRALRAREPAVVGRDPVGDAGSESELSSASSVDAAEMMFEFDEDDLELLDVSGAVAPPEIARQRRELLQAEVDVREHIANIATLAARSLGVRHVEIDPSMHAGAHVYRNIELALEHMPFEFARLGFSPVESSGTHRRLRTLLRRRVVDLWPEVEARWAGALAHAARVNAYAPSEDIATFAMLIMASERSLRDCLFWLIDTGRWNTAKVFCDIFAHVWPRAFGAAIGCFACVTY